MEQVGRLHGAVRKPEGILALVLDTVALWSISACICRYFFALWTRQGEAGKAQSFLADVAG